MIRAALALLVVAGAVWIGTHIPHHANPDVFQTLFMHLVPAPLEFGHGPIGIPLPAFLHAFTLDSSGHPTGRLVVTNLQVFQLAAVLLVAICFSGVAGCVRTGRGDATSRLFAGFAHWVRDEMVVPVMGKETASKYLPYFLWVFFFILFMNLLGLIPGGVTATSSIFVTAALATATLVAMIGCGMIAQGPVAFWKNLVPHVPLALWPIMFVIEVVGLVIKPVALTIRLFANMTGGHMIVLSCMGLIMFFAGSGTKAMTGWLSSPLAVGFAVFVMIIESFVALLQAYIFTMLSVLFVNTSIHPEH
jgi:F-type H+-transporting ATPase subunit a